MKKTAVLFFLLATTLLLNALGTLRVGSIKELPANHTNLEVYDADGKYAPVLIIKTELKGLGIQNVGRPTKHAPEYMAGDHQYKFYMNDNQRVVKITHADYEPLEVRLLADHNVNVKAQRVYELVLDNTPEKEFINAVIISEPADATKIIDGKDMGTGQSFELFVGSHSLKLQKSGFKSIIREIDVSRSNTLFNNFVLPEMEPIMITIKSEPNEADIYIDNVNEGKTNKQLFKFSGEYNLRLVEDKFDTIEEVITVTESGNKIFDYTLQKNTSILTIQTNPSNCTVYLDNEKLLNNQKEVSAGTHQVKIIKSGYDDIEETILVEKGIDKTKTYSLQKNTSILTINTTPSNCDIFLNNEKLTSSSKEVSAGMYRVEVKKDSYYEQSRTVNVEKGRNKTESFTLKQKTGKLQFVVEPMEVQVTLKHSNSTIQSWNGSKYLSSLAIGNYAITASLSGYTSQTKQVKINLDETTMVNIKLEKGQSFDSAQDDSKGESIEGMIFVLGGTFQMGSNEQDDEKLIHSATVSDFYIGKYEVTQKEWKAVMGTNPSKWKGDNLPVEKISWYDAVEFCNKKSEMVGLQKCYTINKNKKDLNNNNKYDDFKWIVICNFNANGYRLPTEAEWEYAARGGNKSKSYKFSGSDNLWSVAWFGSNTRHKTHFVGGKQPNELGVYDMSGNVWEWCWDWNGDYSTASQTNPKGPSSGEFSILRGGCWGDNHDNCQVTNRREEHRTNKFYNWEHGFRIVRSSR